MLRQLQGERRRRFSRRDDGQCHRKQTARRRQAKAWLWRARVKRWGKSPPRQRRRWRHEKPRPVQGKIGGWTARPIATGMPHPASPCEARRKPGKAGLSRTCPPQGGPREMTTESRASGRNRIRLTGPKTKASFQPDDREPTGFSPFAKCGSSRRREAFLRKYLLHRHSRPLQPGAICRDLDQIHGLALGIRTYACSVTKL